MKDYCLVKITSCDMPTAWYAALVGCYFECYEWSNDYVLKEDYDSGDQNPWRHIVKYDCIVVRDTRTWSCPLNHRELIDKGIDVCPECNEDTAFSR